MLFDFDRSEAFPRRREVYLQQYLQGRYSFSARFIEAATGQDGGRLRAALLA